MKRYKLLLIAISCAVFGQEIQIKTESPKSKAQVEESNKELATGGAFGATTFDNITSSGLLKLNGTTVKSKLHVNGSLLTQAAHLGEVEVSGEANFKNSVIAQAIQVIGSLRAEKTTFKGPITLTGFKASFFGSKLDSLKILKEANFKGHQVIELKQKTIVDGSIVFEAGGGEVHCYPGSYVVGSITGGKLIKKN
jgi:hypothetical protein